MPDLNKGRVVRKLFNAYPGLRVNRSINSSGIKLFSHLIFCVVCDYSSSKLKDEQYQQKTSPQSYKTEIKILANRGLA